MQRPELGPADVAAQVLGHFGLVGRVTALTGECDANFHVACGDGRQFVFKAACAESSVAEALLPDRILRHLERADPAIPVPRVRASLQGRSRITLPDAGGRPCEAILCTYFIGVPLMDAARSTLQRAQCGEWLARIGRALRDYEDPACERRLIWDVRQFARVRDLLEPRDDLPSRPAIERFMDAFELHVAPRLEGLRRQVVHNDLNARNVIVHADDPARVVGIIDFGDAVRTALVADVAVGAVGQLSEPQSAFEAMSEFLAAYVAIEPLEAAELAVFSWLVAARLVTNCVVVSRLRAEQPGGTHFAGFGPDYFRWRIELAQELAADPGKVLRGL